LVDRHGLLILTGTNATPVLPVRLFRATIQSSPFPENPGVMALLNCPGTAEKMSGMRSGNSPFRRNSAVTS
jgi:hypothetical protein